METPCSTASSGAGVALRTRASSEGEEDREDKDEEDDEQESIIHDSAKLTSAALLHIFDHDDA